ncbi:MAG: helix-turn-helix domain-containing protein [Methylophilaceae bacterium]|nr:helix-turn-helix domain-containing protein [Methyloradius sp.]
MESNPRLIAMPAPADPAFSFNHQQTHDFDEQAALLQGWNQDYSQISSGNFNGFISEMKFQDTHLFMEHTSQKLFQSGKLGDDVIAVGMPIRSESNGLFCGSISQAESMHIFSGSNGFEFLSPTELVMGGISVNRAALLATLSADDQQTVIDHCENAHVEPMGMHEVNNFRQFMTGVFETVSHTPALLEDAQMIESLRASVISLVAESLLSQHETYSDPISTAKCWKIIAESREIVISNQDNAVSVADLCLKLGVSRRTLQYCFQNLLNISPIAYLRAERLNGVRHMLKTANSVTEAAAYWGFWHFGHFSQEYKKMFGELPSMTFKRLRSLN